MATENVTTDEEIHREIELVYLDLIKVSKKKKKKQKRKKLTKKFFKVLCEQIPLFHENKTLTEEGTEVVNQCLKSFDHLKHGEPEPKFVEKLLNVNLENMKKNLKSNLVESGQVCDTQHLSSLLDLSIFKFAVSIADFHQKDQLMAIVLIVGLFAFISQSKESGEDFIIELFRSNFMTELSDFLNALPSKKFTVGLQFHLSSLFASFAIRQRGQTRFRKLNFKKSLLVFHTSICSYLSNPYHKFIDKPELIQIYGSICVNYFNSLPLYKSFDATFLLPIIEGIQKINFASPLYRKDIVLWQNIFVIFETNFQNHIYSRIVEEDLSHPKILQMCEQFENAAEMSRLVGELRSTCGLGPDPTLSMKVPSDIIKGTKCAQCGVREHPNSTFFQKFKKCSRCGQPYYCSKTCQRKHWKKTHKYICREQH